MAKVLRPQPDAPKKTAADIVEDAGSALYRDKSSTGRHSGTTEGGANLASMVAQHAIDEAARLAKLAELEAEAV